MVVPKGLAAAAAVLLLLPPNIFAVVGTEGNFANADERFVEPDMELTNRYFLFA